MRDFSNVRSAGLGKSEILINHSFSTSIAFTGSQAHSCGAAILFSVFVVVFFSFFGTELLAFEAWST